MIVWDIIRCIGQMANGQRCTTTVKQTSTTTKKKRTPSKWNGSKNVGTKKKNKAWNRSQDHQNAMARHLDRKGVRPGNVTLASVFLDQLKNK